MEKSVHDITEIKTVVLYPWQPKLVNFLEII